MKHKLFFLAPMLFCFGIVTAQSGNPAQQLAHLQANRLKDSVGINNVKKQKIYEVNLDIFYKKQRIRSLHASQPVVMKNKIQQVERQRDSLYHFILRPEAKYQLYLDKKDNILSAN